MGSAGNYSVLEVLPETGRIHQIRVHAAALGFPVVCDSLYGKESPVFLSSFKPGWHGNPVDENPLLSRLGLHALELTLPEEICAQTLKAPLPRDMAALIKQMEKRGGFKAEI
jgi:23S rRNA pseudouridine1911/1915/1917 synthase